MPTKLAFRTPVGGVVVPLPPETHLGTVNVANFERIRVYCGLPRFGLSTQAMFVSLYIKEGDDLLILDVYQLADVLVVRQVYEVPGRELEIRAVTYYEEYRGSPPVIGPLEVFVWGYE